MLHAGQFSWRLLDKVINRVLIAQPIATGKRVVEMIVETVLVLGTARGATLGGDSVGTHQIDLEQQSDIGIGVFFGDGDGSPETGTASADNNDVGGDHVHGFRSATAFWYRPPK